MRARAGDPPRTMPQKVLAGRAGDPQLRGDLVQVKVDQVILSRAPARALGEALGAGMKKTGVELAVAYDGACVTTERSLADVTSAAGHTVYPDFPSHDIVIARPGIGFPAPVHLERFAAPARLAITDDPRMATVGGLGMLSLVVSPAQLGQALATGSIWLRPPRSVQIHLSGRVRPFVCARDVSLELVRRGLDEVVRRIEAEHHAPVVLEFVGPSAKLLSVAERAVLCGIAPIVGAAAALFVSDEKTEVFLRDQRRSKAHRALVPDPGAPCEEVTSIDLATVDPLLMDDKGVVRPVRDLAGQPVGQVLLGGDSGVTLRDMLAVAMLLKSKRVPPRLDLLVAPPSRQVLEVLAQTGGLVDLAATGARFLEPDQRVVTTEFYPPPSDSLSLRTSDPEPRIPGKRGYVVASAETLAYAVATGTVGDPRLFKRPVRVTVPRVLPTDDVLVLREKKAGTASEARKAPAAPGVEAWKGGLKLSLRAGLSEAPSGDGPSALVLGSADEVLAAQALGAAKLGSVRALVAVFAPSQAVSSLASEGIACFGVDSLDALQGKKELELPAPAQWKDEVAARCDGKALALRWLAVGPERAWTHAGTSRAPSAKAR